MPVPRKNLALELPGRAHSIPLCSCRCRWGLTQTSPLALRVGRRSQSPPNLPPINGTALMKARCDCCDIRSTPLRRRSGHRGRHRFATVGPLPPSPLPSPTTPRFPIKHQSTPVRNKARCAVTAPLINSVVLRRNNSGFKLGILRFCHLNSMR